MDLVPLAGLKDLVRVTMFQVKQVEMMTNPPSYMLLNVRAGRSQGILTVMGRLDLNLDQLYSSAMLQVWFGKTAGKVSTAISATSSSWVRASVLGDCSNIPQAKS